MGLIEGAATRASGSSVRSHDSEEKEGPEVRSEAACFSSLKDTGQALLLFSFFSPLRQHLSCLGIAKEDLELPIFLTLLSDKSFYIML